MNQSEFETRRAEIFAAAAERYAARIDAATGLIPLS